MCRHSRAVSNAARSKRSANEQYSPSALKGSSPSSSPNNADGANGSRATPCFAMNFNGAPASSLAGRSNVDAGGSSGSRFQFVRRSRESGLQERFTSRRNCRYDGGRSNGICRSVSASIGSTEFWVTGGTNIRVPSAERPSHSHFHCASNMSRNHLKSPDKLQRSIAASSHGNNHIRSSIFFESGAGAQFEVAGGGGEV